MSFGARSLFFKIFLWFWLAMGVLGAAIVLVVTATQPEPSVQRLRGLIGSALALQAHEIAAIYDTGGPEALERHFQDPVLRQFNPKYLVKAGAEPYRVDVLGAELPPGTRALVARAARSRTSEFQVGERSFAAVGVTSARGTRYVVLEVLPRYTSSTILARLLRADLDIQLLRIGTILLAAGLVCFWLARQLAAPVSRLRVATRELADGKLDTRVGAAAAGSDELGGLAQDFNLMAERIERLVNAQRRLLRDISHELRSPLARLNIALGLARQRSDPGAGEALDRIEREAERLNGLIGQLLTLTRLESGLESAGQEPFNLADIVREVAADGDFEAQSRNRRVRLVAADECASRGSPHLLYSAIENVVRNAVRHTPEGTEVEVVLRCTSGAGRPEAAISVRDYGSGVGKAMLANLFQPFSRLQDGQGVQASGAGIGLAIADHAVRLHGGSVQATNTAGGGLLMEIRLPATPIPVGIPAHGDQ
jgi:two-component system sensor histidine kinase CpxA